LIENDVVLRSVLDDVEEAREETDVQAHEHAVLQALAEDRTLDDVEIALNVLSHDQDPKAEEEDGREEHRDARMNLQ
jgi:hypothetical protein